MIVLKQSIQKTLKKIKSSDKKEKKALKSKLIEDLCQYYQYKKDLLEVFAEIFKPKELTKFLEANEQTKSQVIRVNTLKTSRKNVLLSLEQKRVNLSLIGNWSKVGLVVKDNPNRIPMGATPEYLQGQYML